MAATGGASPTPIPIPSGARIWSFADMSVRLDYLLAGFGWCNVSVHLVETHIAEGRLRRLDIQGSSAFALSLHVFHEPARAPGRAGRHR